MKARTSVPKALPYPPTTIGPKGTSCRTLSAIRPVRSKAFTGAFSFLGILRSWNKRSAILGRIGVVGRALGPSENEVRGGRLSPSSRRRVGRRAAPSWSSEGGPRPHGHSTCCKSFRQKSNGTSDIPSVGTSTSTCVSGSRAYAALPGDQHSRLNSLHGMTPPVVV